MKNDNLLLIADDTTEAVVPSRLSLDKCSETLFLFGVNDE